MRYEFRTATGSICCQTDNPAYLCAACKQRARIITNAPPPPPDLAAAIRAARGTTAADRQLRIQQHFAVGRPMAS
jgi:hypothetical protein